MPRLINRNVQIPGGLKFLQPQTGWKAPRFASFDQIVQALVRHRKGNPFLLKKHKWATDYDSVADEVDYFNALICQRMGWTKYIQAEGGQPAAVPFQKKPGLLERLGAVAAGGSTIVQWIASGAEAVPQELAEKRADICSRCPKNLKGDWLSFFTIPVSNAIRKALKDREQWGLKTTKDDLIKVCEGCDCPLPLKVHMPIERITKEMASEQFDALHADCWIRAEKLKQ